MHPVGKFGVTFGLATVVFAASCAAQSLGDVAREQRVQQQQKKDQPKVITNDDIDQPPMPAAATPKKDEPPPHSASKSAEQWKSQILSQKQSIANLKAQIQRLANSIHYVQANLYRNGVEYNHRQDQKQDRVEQMQAQLDEQEQKLAEMQEAARKDGYGNGVYDP